MRAYPRLRHRGWRLLALLLTATATAGCRPLLRWWIKPAAFASQTPPPAPDYTDGASWAALPDRDDWADQVPPGAEDRQSRARVDVFFVHPTTYYRGRHFNAHIDDADTNRATDRGPMASQASVFNGAARVYAPRYRQVTLGAYLRDDLDRGLELAYSDVVRAFDHWLEHWSDGRPFFLASHSQGTYHAQRLLGERLSGESGRALRERLVAAYLIGGWIPEDRHGRESDIPACEGPDRIGCVIGWLSVGESGRGRDELSTLGPGEINLCTNPLLWVRADFDAPAARNLGSLPPRALREGVLEKPEPGLFGARCAGGWLRVSGSLEGRRRVARGGDYHVMDYALFYMNLRENTRARAASYLARTGSRP